MACVLIYQISPENCLAPLWGRVAQGIKRREIPPLHGPSFAGRTGGKASARSGRNDTWGVPRFRNAKIIRTTAGAKPRYSDGRMVGQLTKESNANWAVCVGEYSYCR